MSVLKQGAAYVRPIFLVSSSDHVTGLASASPTVTLSKNGAGFNSLAGTVAEVGGAGHGSGWYAVTLNGFDTDTLGDLVWHITAASADPTNFCDQVQATLGGDISLNASGQVLIASNIKRNEALHGFAFVMTNSTSHQAQTGLSVTATRSLGGGAFTTCVNSVSELVNGWYTITLAAADTNGVTLDLSFTAVGADTLNLSYITNP